MLFKILADFVVLLHFIWIVFLCAGAIWGVRSKAVKTVHLSGLLFAILMQIAGWYCPLTHLEVWLRSKHDPAMTYAGSFIIHYVEKAVYLEVSQGLILALTLIVLSFNLLIYITKKKSKRDNSLT